jgi:hypothetical protein
MIYTINHRELTKDIEAIDVTSHSTTWSRELSPFYLGPVKLYDDWYALNVENAWQYCKVYPEHVDKTGNIKKAYYQWATQGWQNCYAVRYPMGKGAKPLFSLWNGERLTYIEARKKIYIPLYAKAVFKTEAYKKLKELYTEKGELWLLDFDVYRYDLIGYTFDDIINDETRKCGHGFVLAMLLRGFIK